MPRPTVHDQLVEVLFEELDLDGRRQHDQDVAERVACRVEGVFDQPRWPARAYVYGTWGYALNRARDMAAERNQRFYLYAGLLDGERVWVAALDPMTDQTRTFRQLRDWDLPDRLSIHLEIPKEATVSEAETFWDDLCEWAAGWMETHPERGQWDPFLHAHTESCTDSDQCQGPGSIYRDRVLGILLGEVERLTAEAHLRKEAC